MRVCPAVGRAVDATAARLSPGMGCSRHRGRHAENNQWIAVDRKPLRCGVPRHSGAPLRQKIIGKNAGSAREKLRSERRGLRIERSPH
jgi:hypothetical protein